ncbi:MAG TPA: hypothetical protein VF951_15760 [Streptosporangiaceae bacterium]
MISSDYAANAEASPLVALRSKTGAALIAATVLASGVASYDANVIKVAVLAAVGDADLGEASAVNDRRAAAPRIAPRAPEAGCASPVPAPATTS